MENSIDSINAIRVTYMGRVQGVGFRYTVARLAEEHSVLGWVRNANDGSVEMVVATQNSKLDDFLKAVRGRMQQYISSVDQEPTVLGSHVKRFEIRH